jgi:tol-pal system protein YbgF
VTGDGKKPSVSLIARAAAVALLVIGTPALAGLFDDEVARKQIVDQGRRIDAIRQQNDELAGRLARIEDSLKSLAASNPALELAQQLELMRQELKQMRGQMEVMGNDIQTSNKRQRDMYVDLDSRLKRIEQPSAAAAPPPAASPPSVAGAPGAVMAVAPPAQGGVVPQPDEASAYEAAQAQRRIGNYQGAIAAFQSFLAQYPRSQLAPRAQYWIGDSYYNLRDFKSAMANQQKLIATYTDSSTIPDALLNIASSQLELGDTIGARKTMDGLVTRYPASEAAEKARRRLATLR